MSASEVEARVTSIFKLAYSLRTSASRNVLIHTPLSTRSIKGPPGTSWRAVSCCPGARWMAAVVGPSFQIWDTNFIGRPPAPIASFNVKNLEGNGQVWIQWYFSSRNYHLLVVYLRTSKILEARQIVFDLRVDDARTPLLTLRRQLHLTGPLLAANLYDKQLRFWYLDTGEQLPVNESSTLPGCYVNNTTSVIITKAPSKEELLTPTAVPVSKTFDFLEELEGYRKRGYHLERVYRSQIISSRHPDDPLARFVSICDFEVEPKDFEQEIIIFHKAIFVNEIDGQATFTVKAVSVTTASVFPTLDRIPNRPLFGLGNEWFLWWPASRSPYGQHSQIAVYLLGNPKKGTKDLGSFLMIGTDELVLKNGVLEFDPMSGRAVCTDGNTLYFMDFV
ncbi:hypothetical protein DL96DRAFT_1636071 [Flagelloscypha sp. PMI_526]|nr:hypothetical protein DL96DRAFT_1636071 [Flagelloscypha sp. PMI_526]